MFKALALSLLLFPCSLFSQTDLEFSKTSFNFGKVENWLSSIDTIEITNHTDKKIHLLKTNDPRGFELRYPAKAIEPGKTEILEVIFSPKETGKFNYTIPIYHSASQTPVYLTYKGEIVSFDEFATLACPSFAKPSLKPPGFEMQVTVLDSATKRPLGDSYVEIAIGEYFTTNQTDASGILKKQAGINYYDFYAEHPGYQGRAIGTHINPKNHKVIILLPALKTPSASITAAVPAITPTETKPPVILPGTPEPSLDFPLKDYKKNNIVFLIDKSSSMNKPDCMPLLQLAMAEMVKMLRPEDRVTIITYANDAKVVLPGTAGSEHEKITAVINELKCGGRTEGGKAIHEAYKNAEANFIKDGVNQIVIATDGGFNGLSENEQELMDLVDMKAKRGIQLSVLAFGQNRFGKAHIERLAKAGGGFYNFIGTETQALIELTETIKALSKVK